MKPRFRNPDKLQVLLHRDWFRQNMPSGSEGYVVEDLDLVIRAYGDRFRTDSTGKIMLCELKYGNARPGMAQQKTFRLIDGLLKVGDIWRNRYAGHHVINYDNEDWDRSKFTGDGRSVTREELINFLLFNPNGSEGGRP